VKKIAIIGAGQLGSRHLQGLAQCSFDVSIEVVEPYDSSRETAKERYEQIENRAFVKKIEFFSSIKQLSSSLDLVIVATGADVRYKVAEELLESKTVTNLVLEKVLFQTVEEYDKMEKLLKKSQTSCWVNHPRRMFPFYHTLKKLLADAEQVSYSVQGGDWGLGCNSLHFIDHLAFLTDTSSVTLYNHLLDTKLYESKRKGFVEFNGLLVGKMGKHTFSLHSNEQPTPLIFSIVSDTIVIKIEEGVGKVHMARKEDGWKWTTVEEKIVYFQSELSQVLAEDILVQKEVSLPTYAMAKALHVPYINCLLDKMQEINGERSTVCPIT